MPCSSTGHCYRVHRQATATKHTEVWDVNKVLAHLEAGPSLADLLDTDLCVKSAIITFIMTFSRFGIIPKDW